MYELLRDIEGCRHDQRCIVPETPGEHAMIACLHCGTTAPLRDHGDIQPRIVALDPKPMPVALEAPRGPPAPEPVPAGKMVRALADIPPFVDAEGRTYALKAGDVASLSPGIADLLVRRQKAVPIEGTA